MNLTIKNSGHAKGFTLLELIVVISIISLFAALIFPILTVVRHKANQSVCQSNLRQIGQSFSMYLQDNDGHFPQAVDPADIQTPEIWSEEPEFQEIVSTLPLLQDVMQPYLRSERVWRCPSDTGFEIADFTGLPMDALPSSFDRFGTSYVYRTELTLKRAQDSIILSPSQVNMLMDCDGQWHGTLQPLAKRYNVLFVDGHVKNMTRDGLLEVWALPFDSQQENDDSE